MTLASDERRGVPNGSDQRMVRHRPKLARQPGGGSGTYRRQGREGATTRSVNDTQHNDIQHNDTQHNSK